MPSEKIFWVDLRRALVVNAGGPAGKDQPIRFQRGDFSGGRVETDNL